MRQTCMCAVIGLWAAMQAWMLPTEAATSTGLLRQERTPLVDGLDSGFWRTEFAGDAQQQSAVRPEADGPPVAITGTQVEPGGELSDSLLTDVQRQISEWEQAAADPRAAGRRSSQPSGPSLTTWLVAVVAGIVMVGCLLSPRS